MSKQAESVFKDAFGSTSSDHKRDFVDAIGRAIEGDRERPEQLPPLFPVPDRIRDRDDEEDPFARSADDQPSVDPNKLEAKYERFDLSDVTDVARLEKVNNSVLREGWLLAREEWVHTKDGSTFVILKYLVNNTPKKTKLKPAQVKNEEPPARTDGSSSASSEEPL